jgi:excinuclease ABC subunit A
MEQGTPGEIIANPESLTGRYLSGALNISVSQKRKQAPSSSEPGKGWLTLIGARENNLKNITVGFPVGLITCVTGVSGSGKSTLINKILYPALVEHFYRSKTAPGEHEKILGLENFDKVIVIDQSPIGRTPRSNPATYAEIFGAIRELFATLPAAKVRGLNAGYFSCNAKGGRCEHCKGEGMRRIEMHFLADIFVPCEVCEGKRFQREALEITFKGRSIAQVLEMTVEEALSFFKAIPTIVKKLECLNNVGLGYLKLGQSATTLSGGEAQRLKLASELGKRDTGKTLYLLDEPTTGLHVSDIQKLLEVLFQLRDRGNTLLIIEHQLNVIQSADWVIDLGPEGGDAGGHLVAVGTPEAVARCAESVTGSFLK